MSQKEHGLVQIDRFQLQHHFVIFPFSFPGSYFGFYRNLLSHTIYINILFWNHVYFIYAIMTIYLSLFSRLLCIVMGSAPSKVASNVAKQTVVRVKRVPITETNLLKDTKAMNVSQNSVFGLIFSIYSVLYICACVCVFFSFAF